jgi:hypothetical protein
VNRGIDVPDDQGALNLSREQALSPRGARYRAGATCFITAGPDDSGFDLQTRPPGPQSSLDHSGLSQGKVAAASAKNYSAFHRFSLVGAFNAFSEKIWQVKLQERSRAIFKPALLVWLHPSPKDESVR